MQLVGQKLGRTASLADTQKYLLESFLKREDPVVKADRAVDRSRGRSGDESIGKASRAIPAAIRHVVFNRDRGCCQARRPDGSLCLNGRWVHVHHVIGKAEGGADTVENLITLCSSHHRLWHDQHG